MDALDYGHRCTILRQGKPVLYISKALQHERGYVAIEKEALAVVWAMENFLLPIWQTL